MKATRWSATRCTITSEAAYALGTTLEEPFLQVAFLPLPVIPHLKISDMGMVDVDKFALFFSAFRACNMPP
jgi:adenine deaminase